MEKNGDRAAGQVPDTAGWERWILQLSERMREVLQTTVSLTLAGMEKSGMRCAVRPMPVSAFLTEQIVSGAGDTALSLPEGTSVVPAEQTAGSSLYVRKRRKTTPYETARALQRQSELLLRT